MNKCLIALGGNVEISELVFKKSVERLQERGCQSVRLSHVHRTRPVGTDAGGEFLNAAAVMETDLSPGELLNTLHEVEAMFRRVRTRHWGPRTLDLDLILYEDEVCNSPHLVLPHPAMWYRRFVLEPASEVAGDLVHPILRESVAQITKRLMMRPLRLEICQSDPSGGSEFLDAILVALPDAGNIVDWCVADATSQIAPDAFARIAVSRGERTTSAQPYNRAGREIVVQGQSPSDVLSQIEYLTAAMSG